MPGPNSQGAHDLYGRDDGKRTVAIDDKEK